VVNLAAQARSGRSGVAAIGITQEYQSVLAANQRQAPNDVPWFSFGEWAKRQATQARVGFTELSNGFAARRRRLTRRSRV